MSRRHNKTRRRDRKAKREAFEAFEEAFPWRSSHTPLFVYAIMEASQGREATLEYKRQRDEERRLSIGAQLDREKCALWEKFHRGAWREGVEGLGVRPWGRPKRSPTMTDEELRQARRERAFKKKARKASWGPEPVEYVDAEEADDSSGVIEFTPRVSDGRQGQE